MKVNKTSSSKKCRTEKKKRDKLKIWLVTVDMGYGHQRASYPLRHLAYKGLINANNYEGIPAADRKIWLQQRKFYEAVSRFTNVPVIGRPVFEIFDKLQEIPKFYPKRDLSRPSLQLLSLIHLMKHGDWGKHLIHKLAADKKKLPLVTPFSATAIMAEVHNYPGDIYCIICDTDISRAWVSATPKNSRIKYFVPNLRVVKRLKEYGVAEDQIFLTGFPLPDENLGCPSFKTIRDDLKHRLLNLDPEEKYISKYKETLLKNLKIKNFPPKSNHKLTVTFAVGGAGAQRELGHKIIKGLSKKIKDGTIRINLIAGVHQDVNQFFIKAVKDCGLKDRLGRGIEVLYEKDKQQYFKKFNHLLRKTDLLWTKPSELSFYCALGIPIIIAPPIGSQEEFNMRWLVNLGAGIKQQEIKYVDEWFEDAINTGWFAEAAAQGFLEAPKLGTYNIEKILAKQEHKAKTFEMVSPYL
jgi:hypothetical protein